jgi:hypothetical protein
MGKITVTAGNGRTVPIHHSIATGPGGALRLLVTGDELEVDDAHTSIQRSLRNGDLVRVARPRARDAGETFSAAPAEPSGTGPPPASPPAGEPKKGGDR